jgi:hypothetical protein
LSIPTFLLSDEYLLISLLFYLNHLFSFLILSNLFYYPLLHLLSSKLSSNFFLPLFSSLHIFSFHSTFSLTNLYPSQSLLHLLLSLFFSFLYSLSNLYHSFSTIIIIFLFNLFIYLSISTKSPFNSTTITISIKSNSNSNSYSKSISKSKFIYFLISISNYLSYHHLLINLINSPFFL